MGVTTFTVYDEYNDEEQRTGDDRARVEVRLDDDGQLELHAVIDDVVYLDPVAAEALSNALSTLATESAHRRRLADMLGVIDRG